MRTKVPPPTDRSLACRARALRREEALVEEERIAQDEMLQDTARINERTVNKVGHRTVE